MFKKIATAVALSLALVGCAKDTHPVMTPTVPLSHPALPAPVGKVNLKWKVIPQDDHVYVALTYDDSLQLKMLIEDLVRYTREANSVMCFYRRELKEPRCLAIEK